MTKEEYKVRLKNIEEDCENRKRELMCQYCALNNQYQKGDVIISVGGDIIEVSKITPFILSGNQIPECKYTGKRLRKDLTPYKSGEEMAIVQSLVDKKIER